MRIKHTHLFFIFLILTSSQSYVFADGDYTIEIHAEDHNYSENPLCYENATKDFTDALEGKITLIAENHITSNTELYQRDMMNLLGEDFYNKNKDKDYTDKIFGEDEVLMMSNSSLTSEEATKEFHKIRFIGMLSKHEVNLFYLQNPSYSIPYDPNLAENISKTIHFMNTNGFRSELLSTQLIFDTNKSYPFKTKAVFSGLYTNPPTPVVLHLQKNAYQLSDYLNFLKQFLISDTRKPNPKFILKAPYSRNLSSLEDGNNVEDSYTYASEEDSKIIHENREVRFKDALVHLAKDLKKTKLVLLIGSAHALYIQKLLQEAGYKSSIRSCI